MSLTEEQLITLKNRLQDELGKCLAAITENSKKNETAWAECMERISINCLSLFNHTIATTTAQNRKRRDEEKLKRQQEMTSTILRVNNAIADAKSLAELDNVVHAFKSTPDAMTLFQTPSVAMQKLITKAHNLSLPYGLSITKAGDVVVYVFTFNMNNNSADAETLAYFENEIKDTLHKDKKAMILIATQEEQYLGSALVEKLKVRLEELGLITSPVTLGQYWVQTNVTPGRVTVGGFAVGDLIVEAEPHVTFQHSEVNSNKGGITLRITLTDLATHAIYKLSLTGVHLESKNAIARMEETLRCMDILYGSDLLPESDFSKLDYLATDLAFFGGDFNSRSFFTQSKRLIHPLHPHTNLTPFPTTRDKIRAMNKHSIIHAFAHFIKDGTRGITHNKSSKDAEEEVNILDGTVTVSTKRRGELDGGEVDAIFFFGINIYSLDKSIILFNKDQKERDGTVALTKSDHASIHMAITLGPALRPDERVLHWVLQQLDDEIRKPTLKKYRLLARKHHAEISHEQQVFLIKIYNLLNSIRHLEVESRLVCLKSEKILRETADKIKEVRDKHNIVEDFLTESLKPKKLSDLQALLENTNIDLAIAVKSYEVSQNIKNQFNHCLEGIKTTLDRPTIEFDGCLRKQIENLAHACAQFNDMQSRLVARFAEPVRRASIFARLSGAHSPTKRRLG